jgi:sigma-B regulation protein RsbQ
MTVSQRNNVRVLGQGSTALLFAHGFGCDQHMWRYLTPAFENEYRVVLFDHVGAGRSDLTAYHRDKYGTLEGYATDVLDICQELALERVIVVGHSVSAMIAVLAAKRQPTRFNALVLIGPSPCYLDTAGYTGGFSRQDIDELLNALDANYLGWSTAMAPAIMGNPDRPALGQELTNSFCRTDPEIAKHFAHVTFLSDNREDLAAVDIPTLILQCADDIIAPPGVGTFIHEKMRRSELVDLTATGHCPHLSAPEETTDAIQAFLRGLP